MSDSLASLPRLSRSLSSSESTPSSSPKEGILDMEAGTLNVEFPSDDGFKKQQDTTPHGSDSSHHSQHIISLSELSQQTQATVDANTFCSPKAPSVSVKDHTIDAHKCMYARYRPYVPRNRVTLLELRFAARSLGSSSHTGMTMEDVIQGQEYFSTALSAMPDRVLLKAYQAKQVNRNCIAHRVALALAEIESAKRHKDYLTAVHGQHEGALAVTSAQLQLLAELLDDRGLSDVEDDGGFHRAVYADELIALTIAEGQTDQVKEVVDSRAHPIWPDPDNESLGKDEDNDIPFMGLLPSDDSVF
ncbi:hypothetical protein SCLCIDRAFT_28821 [Scleroderma citrinum Foug A]|uniref:Uncharacterized protein n=1 Tax=Scleroderma citrinum Foug A TaxID=1036808 RepID=A0A0C2Z647_9AGAM|nr:hypothetical protein SCLCIDRAFT_28821 [Scleroderma citrinum Foug A]